MGGDTTTPISPLIYSTGESSFDQNFPENPLGSHTSLSGCDHFGSKVENGEVGLGSMDLKEFVRASSNIMDEVNKKRIRKVYMDFLKSYDEVQFIKDHLKEAKNKILRASLDILFNVGCVVLIYFTHFGCLEDAVLAILLGMAMMFRNTLQAKVASVPNLHVSQSHRDVDRNATTVDYVPDLQPEELQPHVNVD
ncbi:hypothetical protein K7X08_029651 [Anisodus acutangulus]|uniref:Uncharacterized protein n=1 Tax=Anisodus acutangulus TaxID=402998 RepID=A0A9Q1L4Q9_9SOLA|nr:hypothetical protein K7X08_029651 [Anisodus acutangulus]